LLGRRAKHHAQALQAIDRCAKPASQVGNHSPCSAEHTDIITMLQAPCGRPKMQIWVSDKTQNL